MSLNIIQRGLIYERRSVNCLAKVLNECIVFVLGKEQAAQ